jgi:hypothetical protein
MALTKILKPDLDVDIQDLLTDLENAQEAFLLPAPHKSLAERLANMDTLLEDFQNAQGSFDSPEPHKSLAERLALMDTLLKDVQDAQGSFDLPEPHKSLAERLDGMDDQIALAGADPEEGNYNEAYLYDANGNVTKETMTGDHAYTVDYVYADPVNGILDYSDKKYVDADGKNVTIHKKYTYDAVTGNITSVATTTTKA